MSNYYEKTYEYRNPWGKPIRMKAGQKLIVLIAFTKNVREMDKFVSKNE